MSLPLKCQIRNSGFKPVFLSTILTIFGHFYVESYKLIRNHPTCNQNQSQGCVLAYHWSRGQMPKPVIVLMHVYYQFWLRSPSTESDVLVAGGSIFDFNQSGSIFLRCHLKIFLHDKKHTTFLIVDISSVNLSYKSYQFTLISIGFHFKISLSFLSGIQFSGH